MPEPVTIHGELRLPAAFLQGRNIDVIEHQLHTAGILPVEVREIRWRMDAEAPGGYILTYTVSLTPLP